MKHLLNDLNNSEKNRILEQYNNSLIVETKKFNKLINSKLGNVKPLLVEGETHTGESLRWEIDDDKILYFPGVTTIEGRKDEDKKGKLKKSTKPGLKGKFTEGIGMLYFNQDYQPNGVQLNYKFDYSIDDEIKTNDIIIGTFEKEGLISGKLYRSLESGAFGEPAWDLDNPITLDLKAPDASSNVDFNG